MIAALGIGYLKLPAYFGPTEYTAEPQVVEKTVEVDVLDKAIKDAQSDRKSSIEEVAHKAWQDAYDQEMKKVELEVIESFSKKLDARQEELKKQTEDY